MQVKPIKWKKSHYAIKAGILLFHTTCLGRSYGIYRDNKSLKYIVAENVGNKWFPILDSNFDTIKEAMNAAQNCLASYIKGAYREVQKFMKSPIKKEYRKVYDGKG